MSPGDVISNKGLIVRQRAVRDFQIDNAHSTKEFSVQPVAISLINKDQMSFTVT